MGKTLIDKVWDKHIVSEVQEGPSVLYIDRHFIHEVTSPQAFAGLEAKGLQVSFSLSLRNTVSRIIPENAQARTMATIKTNNYTGRRYSVESWIEDSITDLAFFSRQIGEIGNQHATSIAPHKVQPLPRMSRGK